MRKIKTVIFLLLLSCKVYGVNDQGFVPIKKTEPVVSINMKQLFSQGTLTGTLSNPTGRIQATVYPTCRVPTNAFNYFSSVTRSDDPTMILDSATGYVAENNFVRVKVWGSLGTSLTNYVLFPWNTSVGPGSNGFNCDLITSYGIFTAENLKYEITRKRPFSAEEQFNYIKIYVFGGRQVDTAGTPPNISTAIGDEISIITIKFTDWYTPYTCTVQMDKTNGEISFGSNTVAELIAGLAKKTFTLSTKCNTTTVYNVDAMAVNIQFTSDITPAGQGYFNTINSETKKVSDKLVFVLTNETLQQVVKNNELVKLSLPANAAKTEFTRTVQYSVQPKWIGGDATEVPLGGYEASGIIYVNLE